MNSIVDTERIAEINPINASQLLKEDTHKLFVNSENGDLLELAIQCFRSRAGEILGAVIIVGHRESGQAKTITNCTYILRPSGEFGSLDTRIGGVFMEIEPYIPHMLLNSVGIGNWIPQDIEAFDREHMKTKRAWSAIGMKHNGGEPRPKLENVVTQAREMYLKMMSR